MSWMTEVPWWRFGDDPRAVAEVVGRGGVLAIPTESSYGLAVDPLDAEAVAAVAAIKGRSREQPLPVVFSGPEQLARLGVEPGAASAAGLDRLWPSALSLLLPCAPGVAAAAGTGRLVLRVPDHAGLVELLSCLGMALTATSANRTGEPPILEPAGLVELLAGHDALIVDGGALAGGAPSTLVAVEGGVADVLRLGRVSLDELRRAAPTLELRSSFSAAPVEIPVEEPA